MTPFGHDNQTWESTPSCSPITPDMVLARHRKMGREIPASANKWGRYLRALLTFAAGRYTDSEGRPILTDDAVKVLSRARSWYRVARRQSVIQPHQRCRVVGARDPVTQYRPSGLFPHPHGRWGRIWRPC